MNAWQVASWLALGVLAACGSDRSGDAPASQDRTASSVRLEASSAATAWDWVADEWQSFTLEASATVRYGAGDTWLERTLPAGQAWCRNDFFGIDPLPGFVKRCERTTPGVASTWKAVADEWADFTLDQATRVRYGAADAWIERDLPAGAASCTNAFFGTDPIVGKVKRCERLVAAEPGGGGGPVDTTGCDKVLTLPSRPADAMDARVAGAKGDGVSDDTDALQAALDALRPGQWLVFPPGVYRHSSRLVIRRAGVVLDGRDATLHATNPRDQALMIQANDVRIHGFTLTAVTESRGSTPWEARIAVWRHGMGLAPVEGVVIVGNQILESGPPGSPRANSASANGIFVHNARDFVVARNTVRRSLADAIHITGGSQRGQVVFNTVRESGDDMVGIVSYLDEASSEAMSPASAAASLPTLRAVGLVRDILVADNDLAGQYWGRGVAVVGGEDVAILRNTIDATTHAAAVYLAREHTFGTFGVRNVRVEGNRITRVQTTQPAYLPPASISKSEGPATGHGAVELVAMQFDDEAAQRPLRDALVVRGVRVAGNRIEESSTPAMRTGYGHAERWYETADDGSPRWFSGATVAEIAFESNVLGSLADGVETFNANDPNFAMSCSANVFDGQAYTHTACRGAAPAVTGSSGSACRWTR